MLKPQDVFISFETFCDWWIDVMNNELGGLQALALWVTNKPCVPGSYGISINV